MSDLIDFLRARLDEDEEAARLAETVDPSPWYEDVSEGTYTNQRDGLDGVGLVRAADNVGLWDREQSCTLSMAGVAATHIARHDPARALREVAAKRRLIEAHHRSGQTCPRCSLGTEDGQVVFELDPCETLRLLALPYVDHPDYQPEWAPRA